MWDRSRVSLNSSPPHSDLPPLVAQTDKGCTGDRCQSGKSDRNPRRESETDRGTGELGLAQAGGWVEVVTPLGTDRLLRDGEAHLATHTELGPQLLPVHRGGLRGVEGMCMCRVCACMHTGASVYTYVGMCIHVSIYIFLLCPPLELSDPTLVRSGL